MKKTTKTIMAFALTITTLGSCVSVKEYQKMYLNDSEMELTARKVEYFETNFQTYREGASGANGGKVGGGCGCN
ncbi:MAG: DUF4266 domain-containing protein [Bacteroidota bacterium]